MWWNAQARKLGVSRHEAFSRVPLKEIGDFQAEIHRGFGQWMLEPGASTKQVKRITKLLESGSFALDVAKRQRAVLKRLGITLGALAALGAALDNVALGKNIVAPNSFVQNTQKRFLEQYERALGEKTQDGRISQRRWGLLADAVHNYLRVLEAPESVQSALGLLVEKPWLFGGL
jgi:hypothetical protein